MSILEKLKQTTDFINSQCDDTPEIGVTLGSGLSSFADEIEVNARILYSDIPHFSPPTVEGHPGSLVLGKLQGKSIAILQGRIHFYEGHSMEEVIYPTRALGSLGVKKLIVTNAAGGLDPKMIPGDLMVIRDHINLTGTNPLLGPNHNELGPRFPDMSQPYSLSMIKNLEKVMTANGVRHSSGVYCGVTGPSYETAAEVRYLGKIGGHAVGMSTVPEVIAATHMGIEVCGISCITNLGTGLSDSPLDHNDVKSVAKQIEKDFCKVLSDFIVQSGSV